MSVLECKCELAGYCKYHNIVKNNELHTLCKMNRGVFSSFEVSEPVEKELSIAQKAVNYISAEIKHTFHGRAEVSEGIYNDRMSICRNCEFFKSDDVSCLKCGCYLETKCKWVEQECPEQKWLAETGKSSGCSGCK